MTSASPQPSSGQRWVVLAVAVLAQSAACSFVYGLPFLVPILRDRLGLSLAAAGAYVAAPTTGLLLTLIAWGAAADRFGERVVMATGMTIAAGVIGGLALLGPVQPGLLLGVGGAAAASVFAANGRLIMGWFPRTERGLAMGVRQMAQPLGVALAGFALPSLAQTVGVLRSLGLPAALCLLSAVLITMLVRDPARPPHAGHGSAESPYRTPVIWRVHLAGALLVVPQFAIGAFSTEYLVRRQGWGTAAAGAFVAAVQVAGAGSRVGAGVWSDRVGSRLRPMRQLAVAATLVLLVFALGDLVAPWLAVTALAVGGVISVADNGLAFTSVAELAGSTWSGRALGTHNTLQNLAASATPAALGAMIGATGYAAGFALAALAPLAATPLTPVADEPEPQW